jgi:hypothetical protein
MSDGINRFARTLNASSAAFIAFIALIALTCTYLHLLRLSRRACEGIARDSEQFQRS